MKYEDLEAAVREARAVRESISRLALVHQELEAKLLWIPVEANPVKDDLAAGLKKLQGEISRLLGMVAGGRARWHTRPLDDCLSAIRLLEDERDRHREKAMVLKQKVKALQAELLDAQLAGLDRLPSPKDRIFDRHESEPASPKKMGKAKRKQ